MMIDRNVLLHYLNLEYRRIVGLEKFISENRVKHLLHGINYVALLLCREYCLIPYSALVEDTLISDMFLEKNYDVFFEVGLIRASLREDNPQDFLEKKIKEYDSSPELYGYYKESALRTLEQHDVLIVKRDFKVGNAIRTKWENELEEYASKSVWRDVVTDNHDKELIHSLREIPKVIIDSGKGIIWPLVKKMLGASDYNKMKKIRDVLHHLYFSNFVDEQHTVVLTNLPFSPHNFSLERYRGQNYNYNVFTNISRRLGIFNEICDLNSNELFKLKMSSEFQVFLKVYHEAFSKCVKLEESQAQMEIFNSNLRSKEITERIGKLRGLEKILQVFELINPRLMGLMNQPLEMSAKTYYNMKMDEKYDIGILTALYEHEFEKVELHIGSGWDHNLVKDETKVYTATEIHNGNRTISAIGSYQVNTGMVEAGIFATEMINKFRPDYLIMSGVLAGKPEKNKTVEDEVNFGDIVVGTKLFTYEKGKHTEVGFDKDLESVEVDSKLLQLIRYFRNKLLNQVKNDLREIIAKNPQNFDFGADELRVHIAPIACSLSVVNKKGVFQEKVSTIDRKTTGLEMESYGVARACKLTNDGKTRALIIKSVMDKSEDKDDKNKELAALTSALFVKHLIKMVLFPANTK